MKHNVKKFSLEFFQKNGRYFSILRCENCVCISESKTIFGITYAVFHGLLILNNVTLRKWNNFILNLIKPN